MKKATQVDKLLNHMKEHGSISSMDAFALYGITRLSARIWDLRHAGNVIESKIKTGKNRDGQNIYWCEYRLAGDE